MDGTSFRDQLICASGVLPSFITCANIVVDVRSSTNSNFTSLGANDANSSFMATGAQYVKGLPCQIMIVRAVYPMPSYLPSITWGANYAFINNLTGLTSYKGSLVQFLSAASVFRNEPYLASNPSATSCS